MVEAPNECQASFLFLFLFSSNKLVLLENRHSKCSAGSTRGGGRVPPPLSSVTRRRGGRGRGGHLLVRRRGRRRGRGQHLGDVRTTKVAGNITGVSAERIVTYEIFAVHTFALASGLPLCASHHDAAPRHKYFLPPPRSAPPRSARSDCAGVRFAAPRASPAFRPASPRIPPAPARASSSRDSPCSVRRQRWRSSRPYRLLSLLMMRREPHANTTRVALRSQPALHRQGEVSGCACATKCFRTHTNPPTLPVALTPPCCGGGVDCRAAAAWAVVEHCPAPNPPQALVPSPPPSPCGVPRSHDESHHSSFVHNPHTVRL